MEEHTQRLREAAAAQDLAQENARLMLKLTGQITIGSLEAGDDHATHKRVASSSLPHDRSKLLKFADPPAFEGKSIKQLDEFDRRWQVYFDADDTLVSLGTRIRTAAAGLRGEALSRYLRAKEAGETHTWTWDNFIRHLRDAIVDPVNRTANVQFRLKELHQGDRQGVNGVLAALEQLENELPAELSAEEQKAWTLLSCYKPAVRNAVLQALPAPKLRSEVAAVALRVEGLLRDQDKDDRSYSPRPTRTSSRERSVRPMRHSSSSQSTNSTQKSVTMSKERSEKTVSSRPVDARDILCHNCGRKGHYQRDCRAPRRGAGEEHPKNTQPAR